MKKIWIILPAVALAALAGFMAQGWFTKREPAPVAEAEVPAAEGEAVSGSGSEAEAAAPTIPDTLPQIALADRDGKMRTLGDWKGRPLMVNYWATWCGPCRREIPLLNELRARSPAANLEIIGIAVDFRDDVLKYASETPIDYPLLIGEEDGLAAVQAMGMEAGFPFTVFADSQQRILTVKVGELHREEAELILERLARVDAGSLSRDQAKTEIDAGMKDLAAARAAKAAAAG